MSTLEPQYIASLAAKYVELQELKKRLDTEIVAVEQGLRVAGLLPAGRPKVAPTHTAGEARDAHRRHAKGERSDWVDAGERQYQREAKRRRRLVA